jgi:hypothetical protein
LNLALQLLRTLLGLAPQIFDLPLHRGDLFLLLADPEGQGGFSLLFCLVANGTQFRLHLLLDGQVDLALGVVELALLLDQVGLGLLGFGQLAEPMLWPERRPAKWDIPSWPPGRL